MQDNASIHTARPVRDFFDESNTNRLRAPAKSPDLNPIENLWANMTRSMDEMVDARGEARTEDELFERVVEAGQLQQKSQFMAFYRGMNDRMTEVIRKNGDMTRY
jgi:hypothetical protein